MLTTKDISQIRRVVREEIRTETPKIIRAEVPRMIQTELIPIKRDLKKIVKKLDLEPLQSP